MIRFNDPRLTNIKARLQATQWAQRLTKRGVRPGAPVISLPAIATLPAPPLEGAFTQETPVMEHRTSAPSAPARFFAQIRLGDAAPTPSDVIEQHMLASENRELQGLAARCADAFERLAMKAAHASFVSRAIEETQGTGSTPQEWLASTLKALEVEGEITKQEHSRQEIRRKARFNRLWPLRDAVSQRLTAAEVEIPRLVEKVRLAEKNPFGGQSPSAYQRLIDAGLTPEQIKLTGTENPVSQIEKGTEAAKARIAMLQAELPALWAFSKDPLYRPEHLAGLPGFDALIASAQRVVEEAEPCQA